MKYRVKPASKEDIYRDFARIPEQFRKEIDEGSVVQLMVNRTKAYAIARGSTDPQPTIAIDERTRNLLGIKVDDEVAVRLKKVRLRAILWAWSASDPAYRVAAKLGILSVGLGLIGFVLGLLSLTQ